MIGIVVSRADDASEHLGDHLLALREWTAQADDDRPPETGGGTYHRCEPFELRTFDELHLELDDVADAFDAPDLIVFASRHSGETGPLLTGHFTGNLGSAEFGGENRSLAEAAPAALSRTLSALDEHAPEGYDTGIECTHHGPSDVGAPSLFVELGSGPEEWADAEAAEAVARAILALEGVDDSWTDRTVVGLGGGHYAKRFERIVRETGWSVGHVAADWGIDAMGDPREHEDVVRQLFEKSRSERAVIDGDRPEVAAVVRNLGYEVVSETWLRAVDCVELDLATSLEAELATVDEGLRFGTTARDFTGSFEVVDLPDELLGAARGVDRERTRTVAESHLLAFETTEGASKVEGQGAVARGTGLDGLVSALADVLREKFERVERDGDAVVVREQAFDPELARDLGVPDGPKFGRLANGEAIEIDGNSVQPEDVLVTRTKTFPIVGRS